MIKSLLQVMFSILVFAWACKKQRALDLFSAGVEYQTVVNASQEALWL
jgi:hypothetical protein